MATTYTLIDKSILGSTASSITFSSIPSTFTDLKLVASIRTDRTASAAENIRVQFNSDTTLVYSFRYIDGDGSSASSGSGSSAASILAGYGDTDADTSNTFGSFEMYIPNYLSTSNAKSISVDSVVENNATLGFNVMAAGLWNPATQAAITSIKLFPQLGPNFKATSSFYLYGIKNS
jgi:hypothetical protein